jgi:hypothetical protein
MYSESDDCNTRSASGKQTSYCQHFSGLRKGFSEDSSVVVLTEPAKVLDLLLSIVYRMDQHAKSNLRSADFDLLEAVTEAFAVR